MKLTANRIVNYKLSEQEVLKVKKLLTEFPGLLEGEVPVEGDVVPALVVKPLGYDVFNGQAFINGNLSIWIRNVKEGDTPGKWLWPEIEKTDQEIDNISDSSSDY